MSNFTFEIVGKLTSKKVFEKNSKVAFFDIVINEKKGDEYTSRFVALKAFGHQADFVDLYLDKGRYLVVRGDISGEKKKIGAEYVYDTEFIAREIIPVGSKKGDDTTEKDTPKTVPKVQKDNGGVKAPVMPSLDDIDLDNLGLPSPAGNYDSLPSGSLNDNPFK